VDPDSKNVRTTVYLPSTLLYLAKLKDPDFVLSSFVRESLTIYVFGPEYVKSRTDLFEKLFVEYATAKTKEQNLRDNAIEDIYKQFDVKRELEREKLQEEQMVQEERVEKDRILAKALDKVFLPKLSRWKTYLPEMDSHGNFAIEWLKAAQTISDQVGADVPILDCYTYVRKTQEVEDDYN
jgi:hypothetical protein